METILDVNLGWVKCDIDGDGYNSVLVQAPTEEGETYYFRRISRCYGEVQARLESREQVLALMEENLFLVATRHARAEYKRAMKVVAEHKKPEPRAHAHAYAMPDPTETMVSGREALLIMAESFNATAPRFNDLANAYRAAASSIWTWGAA